MLKKGSQHTCLLVILIDYFFRKGKCCYPQVFLEECTYVFKEKKIIKYIIKDIEIYSDESDKKNSHKEISDKPNSDEEISN